MKTLSSILIVFLLASCTPEVTTVSTHDNSGPTADVAKEATPTPILEPTPEPTPTPTIAEERAVTAQYFDDFGSGTEFDPYLLYNSTQMIDFSDQCTTSISDSCNESFKLEIDIDMSGELFHPVGGVVSNIFTDPCGTYSGLFDGNNKRILNLTINEGTFSGVGLFSKNSGTIKNLGLDNLQVTGAWSVGGLVGYNYGYIVDSYVSNIEITGSHRYVGGMVGSNAGSLFNTYSTGTVTGSRETGGLVGYHYGLVDKSYSEVTVNGTSLFIGGLVGDNESGTIDRSYSTGNIFSSGNRVGGLAGRHRVGTISNSYAHGFVQGNGRVGGFVGGIEWGGVVLNSYSTGSVQGVQETGAFVGINGDNGIIDNSYTTGIVNACPTCGGLIGLNSSSETPSNNYSIIFDSEASGTIGVTSEMFDQTHTIYTTDTGTFWDFVNVWEENAGDYPTLQ